MPLACLKSSVIRRFPIVKEIVFLTRIQTHWNRYENIPSHGTYTSCNAWLANCEKGLEISETQRVLFQDLKSQKRIEGLCMHLFVEQ